MEINGASPSAYKNTYDRPIAISNSTEGGDGNINVYVVMPDTVQISPEAAARAYAGDGDDGSDDDDSDVAADSADSADAPEASAEDADAPAAADSKSAEASKEPSTPKSFVYGALGLERPEQTQGKSSDGYDFGRWLSAGVTIGTIISILV